MYEREFTAAAKNICTYFRSLLRQGSILSGFVSMVLNFYRFVKPGTK